MIKIQNLEFSYPHSPVFSGINLELKEGNIYGLLGENGVGKTTLLKIICGLLKSSNGQCNDDGINPFDRRPNYLENIFFVPEDFAVPNQSIAKFAKSLAPFYPNFDQNLLNELLTTFDLDLTKNFSKLSMGQAKKAYISVALSLQTKILLMDEPSNGLDIPSKSQLRKVIAKGANEDNIIVISTHQVRDLENLIDPVIILDKDGVLLNASIEEIAEKLYFSYDSSHSEDALYSEMVLSNTYEVMLNKEGQESKVNLEMLFDTAITHKNQMINLFSK